MCAQPTSQTTQQSSDGSLSRARARLTVLFAHALKTPDRTYESQRCHKKCVMKHKTAPRQQVAKANSPRLFFEDSVGAPRLVHQVPELQSPWPTNQIALPPTATPNGIGCQWLPMSLDV
jgi:hypothetical protein